MCDVSITRVPHSMKTDTAGQGQTACHAFGQTTRSLNAAVAAGHTASLPASPPHGSALLVPRWLPLSPHQRSHTAAAHRCAAGETAGTGQLLPTGAAPWPPPNWHPPAHQAAGLQHESNKECSSSCLSCKADLVLRSNGVKLVYSHRGPCQPTDGDCIHP